MTRGSEGCCGPDPSFFLHHDGSPAGVCYLAINYLEGLRWKVSLSLEQSEGVLQLNHVFVFAVLRSVSPETCAETSGIAKVRL